mgnify:CR=1 FL=1
MSNNNGLTNKAVYDLIDRQLAVWQQASDNFNALANVGVKATGLVSSSVAAIVLLPDSAPGSSVF